MDVESWTAEQRSLREAVRARRRTPNGRRPVASEQEATALEARTVDIEDSSQRPLGDTDVLASVIVVCWNAADVLGRCLDQLLAQDYGSYEIIVVDDGSEDSTLEVAERKSTLGDVIVVSSPRNRGCPHARNLGLGRARGEIVAFIDADGFAAPHWLRHIVDAFAADATIGGVASTVFFEANPLVINGAGGTVNRQGWAADLSMNESYERAEIVPEALYPMGCGMAVRRSAIERVGPFDDRMLNYYDDVDYGVRLWRSGYRVVVAADAWIDHRFGGAGADSEHKRLLCERHRMRVVLKHASARTLARWAAHELLGTTRAEPPRRALKLKAMAWNARHVLSVLATRRRLRRAPRAPERLIDPSWGDGFPAGVPLLLKPTPESTHNSVDMADPADEGQLLYGWFPAEHVEGRSYRWAGVQAAALMRLDAPVRRLRIDYHQVPVDTGGVQVSVRRLGSPDPLAAVWATRLLWRYIERTVENHPLSLAPGDYEILFSACRGWSDSPLENRALAFALGGLSFHESYEIVPGDLDVASPAAEEQLVSGWFDAEQGAIGGYRWASGHAAAVVRLAQPASSMCLNYRRTPLPCGGLKVAVSPLEEEAPAWSTQLAWVDGDWHEETFPLQLPPGDYLVSFDAEETWTNPDQRDPSLWSEIRTLGFALSSLSFR